MAQAPITTIPPFSDPAKLPDCAKLCGSLYDANGACVPPGGREGPPELYTACFCNHAKLAPFSKGFTGVCDGACPGNQAGLQSIANWFQGICSAAPQPASNPKDVGKTGGSNDQEPATPSPANGTGGGNWLSSHWQWVVMLVILVVGIAVIWIGACIWRRRYLRNKDRQVSLGQKHSGSASHPSWGPAVTGSESTTPMTFFVDAERPDEENRRIKEKRKWTVSQRT